MPAIAKNWDRHVVHAEEIARGGGFQALRDHILLVAAPHGSESAVDIGAGTGLLTLQLAQCVEKVWAIDISPSMCEYLRTKAASAGLENVEVASASAISLPLVDHSVDIAVSNYCFHHLNDADKQRALSEAFRVLRPGGRLVFADMMFGVGVADPRDRRVVAAKVRTLLRRGPAGVVRLGKNGLRLLARRWENPARAGWWRGALEGAGFTEIEVVLLEHEGGVATARRP